MPVQLLRDSAGMGHKEQCGPRLSDQLEHQVKDKIAGALIQVSGRLIRKEQLGAHRKGAANCNPLHLSAGQVFGIAMGVVDQPEPVGQKGDVVGVFPPGKTGMKGQVLPNGQRGNQVELLEHQGNRTTPQPGAGGIVQMR